MDPRIMQMLTQGAQGQSAPGGAPTPQSQAGGGLSPNNPFAHLITGFKAGPGVAQGSDQGADQGADQGPGPDQPDQSQPGDVQSDSSQGQPPQGGPQGGTPAGMDKNQLQQGVNTGTTKPLMQALQGLNSYIAESQDPNEIRIARNIITLVSQLIQRDQSQQADQLPKGGGQ